MDPPVLTDESGRGVSEPAPGRPFIGVGAGLLAGAAALLLAETVMPHGLSGLALAAALVLAVPTAPELSRRVLLSGALVLGWLPTMWWWPLPLGHAGHATLALAVLAGSLTGWVCAAAAPTRRLRRLLPEVRSVDAFPALAGLVAAGLVHGWLAMRDPVRALALLLPGWDNSAHVDMTLMTHLHGAMTGALPTAPDGTAWSYGNYPQGFHALAAAMLELLLPRGARSTGMELTGYVRATGLIFVAVAVLVVAAVCAVPAVRSRPVVVAPLATFVWAAFALGPGAGALRWGFPNFVLASALTGVGLALALDWRRGSPTLQLAALGGALVGVAFAWAPMLIIALPGTAAALPVPPLRARLPRHVPSSFAVVLALTGLGLVKAYAILSSNHVATLVSASGGILVPNVGVALAVAAAAIAAPLALLPGWRGGAAVGAGSAPNGESRRRRLLALGPLCGLAAAAVFAVTELVGGGGLSYYFWKYLTGLELVSCVALAVTLATAWPSRAGSRSRGAAVSSAVLLAFGASQLFGYAGPYVPALYGVASQGVYLAEDRALPASVGAARRLFAAAGVQDRHSQQRVVYLALLRGDPQYALNSEQWLRALTGTWTMGSTDTGLPPDLQVGAMPPAAAVLDVLGHNPRQLVVVAPSLYRLLQVQLPDRALRDRVLTW